MDELASNMADYAATAFDYWSAAITVVVTLAVWWFSGRAES
jgi:hypothetical protein